VAQVAAFILLYKLGDMAMGPMVSPFWLERGLSTTEIGLITGTLGIIASIAGGLAGGIFMVRYGIFHGLWFLGLWQSLSNLGYVWVAANPEWGSFAIYVASAVESFCGGLGTAAFLAFLMSICRKEFSATQYALLSALFRVTGIIAGALSGIAAERMGYSLYFALTFFLSLPVFAFIFTAKKWIPTNGHPPGLIESYTAKKQSSGPCLFAEEQCSGPESRSRTNNEHSGSSHPNLSKLRSVAPPTRCSLDVGCP
jgi:PAT family beta-lactamase induction signal transducer AmpG